MELNVPPGVTDASDINAGGLAAGTSAHFTTGVPPIPTPFAYHLQIDRTPG